MALKICVLCSGSGGNCTAIWTPNMGILIDVGGRLSVTGIERLLHGKSIQIEKIRAILVTHGHGDHLGPSAGRLALKYGIPIYLHEETFSADGHRLGVYEEPLGQKRLIRLYNQSALQVGDFLIRPFPIPHRVTTHGFCILGQHLSKEIQVGYLTDLGYVPDPAMEMLKDCTALVIESNHDLELARQNKNPFKQWVMTPAGHLNNDNAGQAIAKLALNHSGKLEQVMLAHISRDNNTPKRALSQVRKILKSKDVTNIKLYLTDQYLPSKTLMLK